MAAARTAVRGLSTTDLQSIHDTLAAGRKPRVVFTEAAGQIAGQLGHVVGLTDPSHSDEWLVVRFGHDELPFSPTDLAIAPRASARRPQPAAPRRAAAAETSQVPTPPAKPSVPAPREEAAVTSSTVDTQARAAGHKSAERKPEQHKPEQHKPAERKPEQHKSAERKPEQQKPARRAARPKGPAGLTVTLAYTDGEWTVGAQQGSKALAKPYVIKPAEALKMVALLDVPGVHEAVEHIVAAERAEAERAAERLRSELADIEARLAELRDVG
jgi:hypothetical protein